MTDSDKTPSANAVSRWRLPSTGQVLELRYDTADPYAGAFVALDGRQFDVLRVSRLRDGGTTKFELALDGEKHLLVLHRRMRTEPRESFDGEPLERL